MWFWLALISSVFGAIDVILSKKVLHRVSPAVQAWSIFFLSTPPLIYFVLQEGIPAINLLFVIAVFASSLTYVFSKIIFNGTLKQNLVSKILPLTAFGGVFTYIFGLVFLSESIRIIPLLGLLSVIFGAYVLNADQAKEDLLKPLKLLFLKKESLLFLLAIMLSSATSILDKLGLNNSAPASPAFVLLVEQIIMSTMIGGYLIKRESKTWVGQVKNNFGILFLNSIIFIIVGLLIFHSYVDAPVALVLGVQRLRIFFILLMGYLFFKDKPTKHVWSATTIMILGVMMIKLG